MSECALFFSQFLAATKHMISQLMTQLPIQVNFHRLISSYARLSVHCTQTSALLYILFKIQSALSKTDKLRD